MRVLLDTHVWLWMLTEPERLGEHCRSIVSSIDNEALLSAVSSWEISIKWALGRLPLPEPPDTFLPERLASSGVTPMPITHLHALGVSRLDPHHRDPFDRMLVAQARAEDVAIVTSDTAFVAYEVDLVPAEI